MKSLVGPSTIDLPRKCSSFIRIWGILVIDFSNTTGSYKYHDLKLCADFKVTLPCRPDTPAHLSTIQGSWTHSQNKGQFCQVRLLNEVKKDIFYSSSCCSNCLLFSIQFNAAVPFKIKAIYNKSHFIHYSTLHLSHESALYSYLTYPLKHLCNPFHTVTIRIV